MRITKRIIHSPSVLNRAVECIRITPKYPNLHAYDKRVVDGADRRAYDEIIYAMEHNEGMAKYCSSVLPQEIGYIVEHNGMYFAVPIIKMKAFMSKYRVFATEHSKYDIWAELSAGKLYMHNAEPTVESNETVFIYNKDSFEMIPARLPIDKTFRVFTDDGVKTIRPKGDALIYDTKLCNPELLPVIDGVIVDVSGYKKFID